MKITKKDRLSLSVTEARFSGGAVISGKPVTLSYTPAPRKVKLLAPKGTFGWVEDLEEAERTVRFRRPLVIKYGSKTDSKKNWQTRLYNHFKKRGEPLSRLLYKKWKIDGIVLVYRKKPVALLDLLPALSKKESERVEKDREALEKADYLEYEEEEAVETPTSKGKKQLPILNTLKEMFRESNNEITVKGSDDLIKSTKQELFGNVNITEEEIMTLSGISGWPGDNQVTLTYEELEEDGVEYLNLKITARGTHLQYMERSIYLSGEDELVIENEYLQKKKSAPKGTGLRAFYAQVLAAEALGAAKIKCFAYRRDSVTLLKEIDEVTELLKSNPRSVAHKNTLKNLKEELERVKDDPDENVFFGHYVWPRFGYDGYLYQSDAFERNPNMIDELIEQDLLPIHFDDKGDIDYDSYKVSDLFQTKEGTDWWRDNGESFPASFDTKKEGNKDPRSRKVLEKYLNKKAKESKKSLKSFLRTASLIQQVAKMASRKRSLNRKTQPSNANKPKVEQSPTLDKSDESILQEVWREIFEEERAEKEKGNS